MPHRRKQQDSASFDIEPSDLDSYEQAASHAIFKSSDYDQLRRHVGEAEKDGLPILIVDAHHVSEFVFARKQLTQVLGELNRFKSEHQRFFTLLEELSERYEAELVGVKDKAASQILQLEREVRERRQWTDNARKDFNIPDSYG